MNIVNGPKLPQAGYNHAFKPAHYIKNREDNINSLYIKVLAQGQLEIGITCEAKKIASLQGRLNQPKYAIDMHQKADYHTKDFEKQKKLVMIAKNDKVIDEKQQADLINMIDGFAKAAGLMPPKAKGFSSEAKYPEVQFLRQGDAIQQTKYKLINKALETFEKNKCISEMTVHRLKHETDFNITKGKQPKWLAEKYNPQPFQMKGVVGYYDYEPGSPNQEIIWADFANARLGGGVFRHGFVQEEVMFLETPDVLCYTAQQCDKKNPSTCNKLIREGGADVKKVLKGNPKPLLIKKATRVQKINAYGHDAIRLPAEKLLALTETLKTPQIINILAFAAPDLGKKPTEKELHGIDTVKDLFNTLMAGFTLAKEQCPANKLLDIRSGQLGCGAFHNDAKLVYVLHKLAAQQLGLDVKYYDCPPELTKECEAIWDKISPKFAGKTLEECLVSISKAFSN